MAQVDFSYLHSQLQADADLRERVRDAVREVEQAQRSSLAVLSRVHSHTQDQRASLRSTPRVPAPAPTNSPPLAPAVPALLASLDPTLAPVRTALAHLASLVPPQQFYRYNDSFTRVLQQASYIVVLRTFLETLDVPTKPQVAQQLGSASLPLAVPGPAAHP